MKKLLLFCFLFVSINGFTQNIFSKYRIHRILKIMSHEEYDSLKVERKLNRFVSKKQTNNYYFLFKKKYARMYNGHFNNLCDYYSDSNYNTAPNVHVNTSKKIIENYLERNQKLIDYLEDNNDERYEMYKKYNISLDDLLCTQKYLESLLPKEEKKFNPQPEPSSPPEKDTTQKKDTIPEKDTLSEIQNLERVIEKYGLQKAADSLYKIALASGDDTPKFILYLQADGENLVIDCKIRRDIHKKYYKEKEYISEAINRSITDFLYLIQRTRSFQTVAQFRIKGEADAKYKPNVTKMYYAGEFEEINEMYNLNKKIHLQKGDPIDNEMLAFLRGYAIQKLIEKSMKNIKFLPIDAIDHYVTDKKQDDIGTYRNVSIQVTLFGVLKGKNKVDAIYNGYKPVEVKYGK